MKLKLIFSLILLVSFQIVIGQNQEKYHDLVKNAWAFYEAKSYQKSADTYKSAFDQLEGKAYPNDRYNAACSYALAKDIESAFFHLYRLAESKV